MNNRSSRVLGLAALVALLPSFAPAGERRPLAKPAPKPARSAPPPKTARPAPAPVAPAAPAAAARAALDTAELADVAASEADANAAQDRGQSAAAAAAGARRIAAPGVSVTGALPIPALPIRVP